MLGILGKNTLVGQFVEYPRILNGLYNMDVISQRTQQQLLLLLVGIVLTACAPGDPPVVTDAQVSDKPSLTPSLTILPTETELSTVTPTQSPPTELPTLTPSSMPTMIPSLTSTPQPASLTVNGDARCRTGPSLIYDTATYLEDGARFEILGKVENGSWFLIPLEADGDCWISETVVTVQRGSTAILIQTPPPLPTEMPSPVSDKPPLYYYMIKEGLNVSCGNDEAPVYAGGNRTGNLEADVISALNALFANNGKYVAGLLNPIYQSNMRAKNMNFDPNSGIAEIQLAGSFVKPKDDCDSARMRAQVWGTIYQFEAINKAIVWLNNVLLGDLLEGRR
jgi:hypothetical protein